MPDITSVTPSFMEVVFIWDGYFSRWIKRLTVLCVGAGLILLFIPTVASPSQVSRAILRADWTFTETPEYAQLELSKDHYLRYPHGAPNYKAVAAAMSTPPSADTGCRSRSPADSTPRPRTSTRSTTRASRS
jgi:hypothetical protein